MPVQAHKEGRDITRTLSHLRRSRGVGGSNKPRPHYPPERPGTNCIGCWAGLWCRSGRERKISPLPGFDLRRNFVIKMGFREMWKWHGTGPGSCPMMDLGVGVVDIQFCYQRFDCQKEFRETDYVNGRWTELAQNHVKWPVLVLIVAKSFGLFCQILSQFSVKHPFGAIRWYT